jgi:hypothetical protein
VLSSQRELSGVEGVVTLPERVVLRPFDLAHCNGSLDGRSQGGWSSARRPSRGRGLARRRHLPSRTGTEQAEQRHPSEPANDHDLSPAAHR